VVDTTLSGMVSRTAVTTDTTEAERQGMFMAWMGDLC